MGGQLKQYQVLTSPERLAQYGVTLDELTSAVEKSNVVTGGGFLLDKNQESADPHRRPGNEPGGHRKHGRPARRPLSVTVRQVADVRLGGPVPRGTGSVSGEPAVILSVQKQPGADTLALTRRIERTLPTFKSRCRPT